MAAHDLPPGNVTGDVTKWLQAYRAGDPEASSELFHLLYDELRGLASAAHHRRSGSHTLQPTALVHEAWLRLRGKGLDGLQDKKHFLAVATLAMRQILANYARAARAAKRDAELCEVTWTLPEQDGPLDPLDLLALDESLTKLSGLNERHARVVELRFLGSLTIAETAEVLGVSHTTIEADWAMAQAWLRAELQRA